MLKKKRLYRVSLFIVLFMIPVFMTSQLNAIARNAAVVSTSSQANSTSSSSASYPDILTDYTLNINAENAIVVEVGRGMQLFLKNPDQKTKIPAASKIMTAVIALESLPLDTKITVSKVAASQSDAYVLSLKNGEKYTLEYLLYGLILKDNNAAAIAIAEQISGVEEEFVKLMNTKAISYQMMNTTFINATGQLKDNQLTTVSDVARLVRFGLTNKSFETILKTKDIPFFLSVNQSKHLFNNLEEAWSLVETTTGAFQSTSGSQSSFVTTSTSDGINLITIGCNLGRSKIMNDITTITNSIFEDYEFSTLVKEGQSFPRSLQIGDDVIDLQFNQAINYVHPRDTEYIKTTVYEENTVIEYPIRTTEPLARVTFELMDGTKITADLYPSRTIWGESSFYQQLVSVYNSNRDVSIIILISISFLLILGIYHLVRLIARFVHFLVKISKNR